MKYLFSLLFFTLSACTLKVAPKTAEKISEIEAKSSIHQTAIQWGEDREALHLIRVLEDTDQGYRLNYPLTFPPEIPDELTLLLPSDFTLAKKKIRARIQEVKSEDLLGPSIILEVKIDGNSFQVRGLKSAYNELGDRALLKIEEQESDGKIFENAIEIPINKLNTKISTRISLPTKQEFKKLLSTSTRLDLVEEITLTNEGAVPVEISVDTLLLGNLYKDFTAYNYQQEHCSCRTWQESWTQTYQIDLRLLPLDEQLSEDFTKSLESDAHILQIPVGESRTIGLFGFGNAIVSFVDNGSQNSNPYTVEVIDGCETPDPNDGRGPKEPKNNYRFARHETPTYGHVPTGVRTHGVGLNRSGFSFDVRNSLSSAEIDPVLGSIGIAGGAMMILE